jgi:hypothetical protein
MDPQLLERALEASGDDIDSAIKSLNELCLESAAVGDSNSVLPAALKLSAEGVVNNGHLDVLTENPHATENFQTNHHGSEWVELFVREMMSASDIDDARARASRALEALEKSIMERAGTEAVHNLHKVQPTAYARFIHSTCTPRQIKQLCFAFLQENVMLKEQLAIYLRENAVLKRAVAIQHERQKEFDERTQEVHSLKQLVLQYQEQIKTLEINNYALRVHLKQAQQNNSMPGRFPPDVF